MTVVNAIANVGFICPSIDMLHSGHTNLLRDAKSQCDRLIVGLRVGGVSSISDEIRKSVLESVRWVDEVRTFSSDEELIDLIKTVRPDVRFVSSGLRGSQFPGFELPLRVSFIEDNTEMITRDIMSRIAASVLEKNMNNDLAPYMESVRQHLARTIP